MIVTVLFVLAGLVHYSCPVGTGWRPGWSAVSSHVGKLFSYYRKLRNDLALVVLINDHTFICR